MTEDEQMRDPAQPGDGNEPEPEAVTDATKDTAPSLGGVAVEVNVPKHTGVGPQVPEAYNLVQKNWSDVHPGRNAREGEVESVDENAPTTEHDPARGKFIGVNENESRTGAAKIRHGRRSLELYPGRAKEIDWEKSKLGAEPQIESPRWRWLNRRYEEERKVRHRRKIAELSAERRRLDKLVNDELDEILGGSSGEILNLARNAEKEPGAKGWYEDTLNSLADKARAADQEAERKGQLAAAIYDHPPSKAFTEAYDWRLSFREPQDLYTIESEIIPELEEEAEKVEARLREFEESPIEDLGDAMISIQELFKDFMDEDAENLPIFYFAGSKSLQKIGEELTALMEPLEADGTTIGDIKDIPMNLARVVHSFIEQQVSTLKQMIDDVESGKAADPNYQRPNDLNEDERRAITHEGERHRREAEKWVHEASEREGEEREEAMRIAEVHTQRAEELTRPLAVSPEAESSPDEKTGI